MRELAQYGREEKICHPVHKLAGKQIPPGGFSILARTRFSAQEEGAQDKQLKREEVDSHVEQPGRSSFSYVLQVPHTSTVFYLTSFAVGVFY
jgi:hypothetical protein